MTICRLSVKKWISTKRWRMRVNGVQIGGRECGDETSIGTIFESSLASPALTPENHQRLQFVQSARHCHCNSNETDADHEKCFERYYTESQVGFRRAQVPTSPTFQYPLPQNGLGENV